MKSPSLRLVRPLCVCARLLGVREWLMPVLCACCCQLQSVPGFPLSTELCACSHLQRIHYAVNVRYSMPRGGTSVRRPSPQFCSKAAVATSYTATCCRPCCCNCRFDRCEDRRRWWGGAEGCSASIARIARSGLCGFHGRRGSTISGGRWRRWCWWPSFVAYKHGTLAWNSAVCFLNGEPPNGGVPGVFFVCRQRRSRPSSSHFVHPDWRDDRQGAWRPAVLTNPRYCSRTTPPPPC